MSDNTDYREEARQHAIDMIGEFQKEIGEMLVDDGKASTDLFNDYGTGDAYHHETHVDKAYNLLEAANLLDQLDEYEETDSGLWRDLSPRDAIGAQAAYTYGNAVASMWQEHIEAINNEWDDFINERLAENEDYEPTTAAAREVIEAYLQKQNAA